MEILNNLSIIHWVVITAISIAVSIWGTTRYIKFLYKREKILNNNLKRPIKIFFPAGDTKHTMEMEFNLLSGSGLFNVEKPSSDTRDTIRITNHSLVILGCSKNMNNFRKIFEKVQQEKIPVLIYTFGDNEALKKEHWAKLNDYPYYSVCNSPLRLVSDVFTVLSTFPNKN